MKKSKTSFENSVEHKHLGVFRLNHENVDVYYWPHSFGGEFYFAPDLINKPRIKIGVCYSTFEEVLNVALHEAYEAVMTWHRLRFMLSGGCGSSDGYTFILTHPQFTEVTAKVAVFIADVYEPLRKVWLAEKKKTRTLK